MISGRRSAVERPAWDREVVGSIPAAPTIFENRFGRSSDGRAPDCGSGCRGFEPRRPTQLRWPSTRQCARHLGAGDPGSIPGASAIRVHRPAARTPDSKVTAMLRGVSTPEWRRRNPEKVKAYRRSIAKTKARRAALAKWMAAKKATLACSVCGENHPACLHFHHKDRNSKDDGIASALQRGWSVARVEAEMAKCVVLCANCHAKEHYRHRGK